MTNYKVGTDQKAIDSSVKDALKSNIQKGLLKAIHNVDDKRATEAPQAAEAQKTTDNAVAPTATVKAVEAKTPETTEAQKIFSAIADVAVAPNVTSKPTEAKKTICAIAEAAIAPTVTAKAIETKVPEAIEAQEMIDPRIKATLESVIQEDPLEHSEDKDTSGFPKVVPKVNAKEGHQGQEA